jgi:fatty acid desaturase
LVIAGERDGDLRPTEWSWYRRLDRHDLPEKQLLVPPGAKILISPEDDVDDLRSVLELRVALLVVVVIILGFFVRRLLVLLTTTGVAERPPKVITVNGSVVGTWVPWVLFCRSFSNSSCIVDFLPREGRSIAAMISPGFRFRGGPEKSRWPLSLRLSFGRLMLLS